MRKGVGQPRVAVPVQGIAIPQRPGEALRTSAPGEAVNGLDDALLLERDLLDQDQEFLLSRMTEGMLADVHHLAPFRSPDG